MIKRGALLGRFEPRSHSLVVRATGNRVGLSLGSSNLSLGAKHSAHRTNTFVHGGPSSPQLLVGLDDANCGMMHRKV